VKPAALSDVTEAIGARAIGSTDGLRVLGVSRDTRTLAEGDLYFALPGENFDGHDFATRAVEMGAVAVVASRELAAGGPVLLVRDTIQALADLSRWYLGTLPTKVAAITGSVGKTITKEMAGRICSSSAPTVVTQRNLSNEIGVPLTVFSADEATGILVLEFAMRGAGEIAHLAHAAPPSVGAVTNVQITHAERLGGREGIAKAKAELIDALPADGVAVLPAEDDFFRFLDNAARCPVLSFGIGAGDIRAHVESVDPEAWRMIVGLGLPGGDRRVELNCVGEHFAYDAACAAAVAVGLGIAEDDIERGLSGFEPIEGRGRLLETTVGARVLDDTYNAAPASVLAALQVLAMRPGRRIAVLADMLELGPYEEQAHRQVGRGVVEMGIDELVCIGERARLILEEARALGLAEGAGRHFADSDAAAEFLLREAKCGDTLLVKGSRGARTEAIIERLVG